MNPLYRSLLAEVETFHQPQPDKPAETPEAVLRALWFCAAGDPRSIAAVNGDTVPELDRESEGRLRELITLKRDGRPLAHLTGREHFLGLELLAGPDALIPRAETELLGEMALDFLAREAPEAPRILDVCTGSGNLALALARRFPGARACASDISEAAISLATRNAAFTGLAGRVRFFVGDLFAPFQDPGLERAFDLVTCNPPYISSAKVPRMAAEISSHEPRLAFDGGALGLSVLTRLFAEAPRFLRAGGALAFELGAGQGPLLRKRLHRLDWVHAVEARHDSRGEIRALLAVRR
jgi:release factor glutamine methyltransferase